MEPIAVDEPPPVASVVSSRRPKALRPTAVLNALAIGVVAVCPIAFRADPLPVRIGTPLPTYLGLRDAVADARAKMNLGLALAALTSYREEHGGYVGFDDAVGESLAPELAWTGRDVGDPEPLVVHVWKTAPHAALVSAVSGSGAVFCLAAGAHGSATYGQARASSDGVTAEAIHRAVGACGGSPWPSSPPPVPAIRAMCDGVQDGGYVLCRMVQVVAVETLAKSDPTA